MGKGLLCGHKDLSSHAQDPLKNREWGQVPITERCTMGNAAGEAPELMSLSV